ncbi:glycosyltransferase [Branchiibius cervicis]|uniref:Glycosyltransferase n=1 Tax=Branchiibius cervicis TaxID=908252 RepID=A0ABW2AV47_9MICO
MLDESEPGISVIMPILNEERHLAESVDAILAQEYAAPIEVILALGPSHDRTDEVAAGLAAADPRVVLVDNPTGRTPAGLNAAIAKGQYPVVARVDGHGILSPGYLATAVRTLAEQHAANVGGIMDAEGTTDFERAVACAMKSKIGVGGVKFKQGGAPGPADTVYLGVFDRKWLDRVGGYDPRYLRAQDWEMNYRIRQAGGLCGSPRSSRSPIDPVARSGPWRPSTSSTACGVGWWPGSTAGRSTCATWRRRPLWSRSPRAHSAAWRGDRCGRSRWRTQGRSASGVSPFHAARQPRCGRCYPAYWRRCMCPGGGVS